MNGSTSDLLGLLAGLGGFLILMTVGAGYLRHRFAPDGSNEVIENLNARIAAWWVMVVVLGGALLIGHPAVVILLGSPLTKFPVYIHCVAAKFTAGFCKFTKFWSCSVLDAPPCRQIPLADGVLWVSG